MSLETLGMDTIVSNNSVVLNPLGMDYSWGAGGYAGFNSSASRPVHIASRDKQDALGEAYDQCSFADAMLSFTYIQPTLPEQRSPASATDSTDVSQSQCNALSTADSEDFSQLNSPIVKFEDDEMPKPISQILRSPAMSNSSLRARHAANQRHNKTQKARRDSQQNDSNNTGTEEKKQRLREKNKIAAAKCRQQQRRQAKSIQERARHLSEANAQLKAKVQDLRGELNTLRALALYHQECNCEVFRYNCHQAARVAAEYRSTYLGRGSPAYKGQVGRPPT